MPPRSPQDIYARHLLSSRGYPLWTPEPSREFLAYRRDGLRIGDVGVVIPEDGCFDVFFNLCLPPDHPFHRANFGVPESFEPIELKDADIRTVLNAENPGRVIATSSVKTVRAAEPSGDVLPTQSARATGLEFEFTLSSSEGALLILPQGAERCDLRTHQRFLEAARRHGADWYHFVEEHVGQIIGHDSLYLITGLYKTRSWSLAAFEKTSGSAEYPAQLRLPQAGEGDHAATCTWDTTRALDWRVGPIDNYGFPNQTVFIRGFKIAHRSGAFGKKRITVKADAPSTRSNIIKSISAVPGDSWLAQKFSGLFRTRNPSSSSARDGMASDPSLSTTRNESQHNSALAVGKDVEIHRMPEASQVFHPSDIINKYLLDQVPSANIAVTHDSEWIALLENNLLRSENIAHEGILQLLVSQKFRIVSEAGAVYLQNRFDGLRISDATEAHENQQPRSSINSGGIPKTSKPRSLSFSKIPGSSDSATRPLQAPLVFLSPTAHQTTKSSHIMEGPKNPQVNDSYKTGGDAVATKRVVRSESSGPKASYPASKKSPPFHLHWQLLPYDPRRSKQLLRFNVAFPIDEIVFQDRGRFTKPTNAQLDKPAFDIKMTKILIKFKNKQFSWEVYLKNADGIRCRDVFQAVYGVLDEPLTVQEQGRVRDLQAVKETFLKRCKALSDLRLSSPKSELSLGWKRVDALLEQTMFLGLTPAEFDGELTLHLGPPSPIPGEDHAVDYGSHRAVVSALEFTHSSHETLAASSYAPSSAASFSATAAASKTPTYPAPLTSSAPPTSSSPSPTCSTATFPALSESYLRKQVG